MIKEDVRMKKWAPRVLLAAALAGLSAFLLKGDVWTFWTWWLLAFLMGMVAMPVTGRLFAGFEDKGWMFSKVLAITVTGFLTWFLVTAKILPFTAATCIGVSIVCAVGCGVLYHFQGKNGIDCFPSGKVNLIYGEEILFFIFFLMWTYFAGFRPQAYGTEKFMDYGFMEAMMRSTTLPARDLWYSEGTINYYYGGQYFAVFLTKLTGSKVELTYNLMRTFVAAFAFVLPFSLVRQMSVDRLKGSLTGKKRCVPADSSEDTDSSLSMLENFSLVLDLNSAKDSGSVALSVESAGSTLGSFTVTSGAGESVEIPDLTALGDVYDVTNEDDMSAYAATLDLTTLMDNLSNAGVPDEVITYVLSGGSNSDAEDVTDENASEAESDAASAEAGAA